MNYWWIHYYPVVLAYFYFVSPFMFIAHLVNIISGGGKNE